MFRLTTSDVARIEKLMEKVLSPAAYQSLSAADRALLEADLAPFLSPEQADSARTLVGVPFERERLFETFDEIANGVAAFTLEGLMVYKNRALAELIGNWADPSALMNAMNEVVAVLGKRRQSPVALNTAGSNPVLRRVGQDRERICLSGCVLPGKGQGRDELALLTISRPRGLPGPGKTRESMRAQYKLTAREMEVTWLLAQRLSNSEIAHRLGLSAHTTRHHTERILRKLGATNRREVGKLVRSVEPERIQ